MDQERPPMPDPAPPLVESSSILREPQRQSLWAVAFMAFQAVRQIGLLQIAVFAGFVLANLPSVNLVIGLIALVGLVLFLIATLQWWRYTFAVVSDELIVKRGVLQQQTLTIPLDRVQSVSLEQKLLHRIISLVQVSLDTAGTQQAEFVIDAVEQPTARALQHAVENYRGAAPPRSAQEAPPPAPEQVIVRHRPSRVVMIALTQTPFAGLVLLGPLFAFADDLGRVMPFDLPEFDDPSAGWWLVWFIPALIALGLIFSVLLNLARVVLADWNLTLRSTAAGLRRDAGLLSTTSVAATVPRVQIVRIRQGVLERLASLRSVTLATIGASTLSVPGCDVHQAADVRSLALAESDGVQQLDRLVSPTEVFLRTRNTLVVATVLFAALVRPLGWFSLLAFVPVPWVWATTRRKVRLRRWGISNDAIADRRELFGWNRHELLMRKVNGVTVRQSLFERKRDLATVTLGTAAGSISIGMLPADQAREVRDRVLHHVETERRAWM